MSTILQFKRRDSWACPECGQPGNPGEHDGVQWACCSDCSVRWRTGNPANGTDPFLYAHDLRALRPVQR
ncbi:MAG: hypothetical protein WAU49_13960 [Steroidobacteraceae bacterium]